MAVVTTKHPPLPDDVEGLREVAVWLDAEAACIPDSGAGFKAEVVRFLARMTARIEALEKKNGA